MQMVVDERNKNKPKQTKQEISKKKKKEKKLPYVDHKIK